MPYDANAALQVDPIAAQDPSYLAFMRGAGYSEAEVLAELARKQGALSRQLERAAPRFADELRQAGTQVEQDFTNRGLYRSGARMTDQVDAENAARRNELDFRAGIADQRGDLISGATRDIADLRRQAADRALDSRQSAALAAANSQSLGPAPVGHSSFVDPGPLGPAPARPKPKPASVLSRPRVNTQRNTRGGGMAY